MSRRLALALILVASVVPVGATQAVVLNRGNASQISEVPDLEAQVLVAINDLRRTNGLGELHPNGALAVAALGHSVSMAQHGFFSHSGWNGSAFWTRIKPKYRPLPHAYWGWARTWSGHPRSSPPTR